MSVSEGFKKAISSHLEQIAAKDELFATTFKKPNKNIEDCCTYIVNEVQRMHKSKTVAMADDEVYNMAIHYYDEDDIVVGKPTQATASHSSDKPVIPQTPVVKPKQIKKAIENQPSLF
jgi:hypothetical protein